MKKKIAFALALALLLGSLTACGFKGKDGASSSAAGSDMGAGSAISSEISGAASSALPEENIEQPDASGQAVPDAPDSSAPQTPAQQQPAGQPQQPAQKPVQPSGGSGAADKPAEKPQQPQPPAEKAPAVADVAAAVEDALAPEADMMSFTSDDLSALYGLDASSAAEFVGKMPMMNVKATEYLVVKAASGQVETVKKGMLNRQAALDATWKQYLPDQYELVKNYKLVANGDYVLFVVGENAQAAVDAFNSLTK